MAKYFWSTQFLAIRVGLNYICVWIECLMCVSILIFIILVVILYVLHPAPFGVQPPGLRHLSQEHVQVLLPLLRVLLDRAP